MAWHDTKAAGLSLLKKRRTTLWMWIDSLSYKGFYFFSKKTMRSCWLPEPG